MIRLAVTICFAFTLLCPVFCLTETTGECSAHERLDGENCEAMSIGAVVERPAFDATRSDQSTPTFDGLLSPTMFALDPGRLFRGMTGNREQPKPPPAAARRHALLQTFLF